MAAFSRLCVLVIPLLLWFASSEASVLPGFGHVDPATLFGRQTQLDSPLCFPSCELGTCGSGGACPLGGAFKREWLGDLMSNNESDYYGDVRALGKRLFTFNAGSTNPNDYSGSSISSLPTRNEVDAYLPAVFNGLESGYYGAPLPTVEVVGGAVIDERAVSQQVQFGNAPFQIISARMHGCTTIVVASTRGVWMTHLWESFSNGKDAAGGNLVAAGDPAFNQRVLMFLQGQTVTNPLPNGYKDYIAPTGPGIDVNLFNQATDQTAVFIFTPVWPKTAKAAMNNANSLKYKDRYGANGEVKNTIAGIFGNGRPRITMVPYLPLDTSNLVQAAQLGSDARGVALFQYDPNSDGKGKKAWRLFMEDRIFYKNL